MRWYNTVIIVIKYVLLFHYILMGTGSSVLLKPQYFIKQRYDFHSLQVSQIPEYHSYFHNANTGSDRYVWNDMRGLLIV